MWSSMASTAVFQTHLMIDVWKMHARLLFLSLTLAITRPDAAADAQVPGAAAGHAQYVRYVGTDHLGQ